MPIPRAVQPSQASRKAVSMVPRQRKATSALPAVSLGRIVALDDEGHLLAETSNGAGPRAARLAIPLTRDRLELLISSQAPVVLSFEHGDPMRPIIVGVIEEPATRSRAQARATEPPVQGKPGTDKSLPFLIEADVDGRRVQLTAQDELVLRCGEASVTLRRNGRVIVRGAHVETYSTGVNRIKGGQVKIN